MALYLTNSIAATHAWTGVVAVEISAGHVCRTIRVDDTFRLALHVRVALVFRGAGTDAVIADLSGYGATAARVGVARVGYDGFS